VNDLELGLGRRPGRVRAVVRVALLAAIGLTMVAIVVLAALNDRSRMLCVVVIAVLGVAGGYRLSGLLRWRMLGPRARVRLGRLRHRGSRAPNRKAIS
jgi:hypothetical protein